MHELNLILDLLEDSKWHSLSEIAIKSGLDNFTIERVAFFLAQYNFIELDITHRKAKLSLPVTDFLRKIKRVEEKRKDQLVDARV